MKRGLAVLAGVMVTAGATAAPVAVLAQDAPNFPASLEREPLITWLRRETDVAPERVIAVTPQVATSIVSTFPAGAGQGPRIVIRAEALTPETHARTGALSWHVSINADCAAHRVRLGETTGYPQRNLLGERRVLRPADAEWRSPEPGTALDFAWRAACDPTFKGPFQADGATLSAEDPPQATATQAPASRETALPQPAAAPPRTSPSATGGMVVQIGATTSDAEAQALLAKLGDRLGGRPTRVEKALVGGKTWYRSVVAGFEGAGEATRFCAELKAAGQSCFVRAGR